MSLNDLPPSVRDCLAQSLAKKGIRPEDVPKSLENWKKGLDSLCECTHVPLCDVYKKAFLQARMKEEFNYSLEPDEEKQHTRRPAVIVALVILTLAALLGVVLYSLEFRRRG